MNLEETHKEKELRQEAKEKKLTEDRDREEEILLEGARYEAEEMVCTGEGRGSRGTTAAAAAAAAGGTSDGKSNKLKVAHTNVDGLLSSMLEIKECLSSQKPDVFCMAETKLKEEIYVHFQQERFKIWRRDKKGKGEGGEVLIIVKEDIVVEGVQ